MNSMHVRSDDDPASPVSGQSVVIRSNGQAAVWNSLAVSALSLLDLRFESS